MTESHEQLIHETNLLGIQFYRRIRLEENQIEISAQQNITKYPGLLAISKEPEIKYSSLSASYIDWDIIMQQSIELTLLDLIINEFVELTVFTDRKSYLHGLLNFKYKNYHLSVKKAYSGRDFLSSRIIESVKDVEQETDRKATLSKVIHYLIDGHIGSDEHNSPQREFIAALLKTYDTNCNWLTLESQSQFFGMYSRLEVLIEPKEKAELVAAYKVLHDISMTLKRESRAFYLYSDKLYQTLKSDFKARFPSSD